MSKKVLIYECAGGHGECLPSYYSYFTRLGYEVSFIIDRKVCEDKPLWMLQNPKISVINTPAMEHKKHINEVMHLGDIFNYDFYFIATLNKHTYPFIQYLQQHNIDNTKILFQNHLNTQYFLENTNNNTALLENGFVLTHSPDFSSLPPIANNSGLIKQKIKTNFDKINILVTGLDKIHFTYFDRFMKIVDKLNEKGYDIKVKLTGIRRRGTYKIPVSANLEYCGRVNFEELTKLYINNDFLMTFFDKNAEQYKEEHHSFLKGRTSGSRNMSIIYGIPMLVQKAYQESWGMDDTNSIHYNNTEYESLLLSLFKMLPYQYNSIMQKLSEIQNKEIDLCLFNLNNKIEYMLSRRNAPDLVYIVKPGDTNEDLKYSLRSIAKFVPHNKIWIVGHKPSWVTNVGYIHVEQTENKWKNSVKNIIAACKNDNISEDFILMNDDFFAIKPIYNLLDSINLSLGLLDEAVKKQKTKKTLSNWSKAFIYLDELLNSLGVEKPYYNYESHTPLLINKKKYLEVMNLPLVVEFMKTNKVLHKRSLYKNINKSIPKILSKDIKISQKSDDTNDRIKICDWLSVYDGQIGNPNFITLNNLLKQLFDKPCKYEVQQFANVKIPKPQPAYRATSRINGTRKYF